MTDQPQDSICIEPNFKGLFKTFQREFDTQAKGLRDNASLEVARAVLSVLHPVAMALNCATTIGEIEALRETAANASEMISNRIADLDWKACEDEPLDRDLLKCDTCGHLAIEHFMENNGFEGCCMDDCKCEWFTVDNKVWEASK